MSIFQKASVKKRAASCSVLGKDLSSKVYTEQIQDRVVESVFKPETFVGKPVNSVKHVNREKVIKSVVTNVRQGHPGQGQSREVQTRMFYNSNCNKKQVQGLLAKGNSKMNLKKVGNSWEKRRTYTDSRVSKPKEKFKSDYCMNKYVNVDVNMDVCPQNTHVGRIPTGPIKQVAPIVNPSCVMQRGDVNHYSQCETMLHVPNVKQGIQAISGDTADNGCKVVDNGQCALTPVVKKKVLKQGVQICDLNGGEKVGERGVNKSTKIHETNVHNVETHTMPLFDIDWHTNDDKFVNTLFTKLAKSPSASLEVQQLLEKWREQTDFSFGFVPLSEFIVSSVHSKAGDRINCPFEKHKRVKYSGAPNFLKCRFPVDSQLNIEYWKKVLADYWDHQLIHLLEYGFPLDFNRECPLYCEHKNHSSANDFPKHVDAYLDEEHRFGAILGPFAENPITGGHSSPFMTREKSDSDKRRVIVDLSWPKHASVNSGVDKDSYLGTDFTLTFPTVDDITSEVRSLGRGCHLYKVDISRAFRHVKIDPRDYDLLGLEWGDASYIDTCLPFGNRHGTQMFQRISDAVRYVMRQKGFRVLNYVDDFVGVATPDVARHSFDALRALLAHLGLDVSAKKLVHPGTSAVCLGVNIDTIDGSISIPKEKLRQICMMVDHWGSKKFCSKRQLQSLLGYLLYIHKCVKPSRTFLNRMLALLRSNYDQKSITLTPEFKRDLRWFQRFLTQFNGVSFFDHTRIDGTLELDACLTGLGGRWGRFVYHLPLEKHLQNLAIVHLEMINILVAIRIFAKYWYRKHILVRCDNIAVVQVLSSGKTKDPYLATCARNVWFAAALANIDLEYRHIKGRDNETADLLSRWSFSENQYAKLHSLVHEPIWVKTTSQLLELDYYI